LLSLSLSKTKTKNTPKIQKKNHKYQKQHKISKKSKKLKIHKKPVFSLNARHTSDT
jgi:hypothetical protein